MTQLNSAPTQGNDPIWLVLSKLDNVKKEGKGWMATCPIHADDKPSLSVSIGADGKVLLNCFADCDTGAILDKIGLRFANLYPEQPYTNGNGKGSKVKETASNYTNPHEGEEPVAIYKYTSAEGVVTYDKWRYGNKDFIPHYPNKKEIFKGAPQTLYKLHLLISASPEDTVWFVEGEKDVLRLIKAGLVSTTSGGCTSWHDEYKTHLAGRRVNVIPDNDEPGQKYAERVAKSLEGVARSVKIIRLPDFKHFTLGSEDKGKDVSDWLNAGHTVTELEQVAEHTPQEGNIARIGSPTIQLTSLSDLLAEPEEDLEWLVDGLLPSGGISLLAARQKVGKSVTARNVALAVARGAAFLGRDTQSGDVIYLALEEKRTEVAKHFWRMGGRNEPVHIHTGSVPETAMSELCTLVAQINPVLVIIDPLVKFARIVNVNDYSEVYRAMGPIVDLARTSGCHVCILHHSNKAWQQDGSTTGTVMGSIGFTANVDTTLIMNRSKENVRTLFSEQRYGDDMEPIVLVMDPDTQEIRSGGPLDEYQLVAAMRSICSYLNELGAGATEAEIRESAGIDTGKVSAALRRLCEPPNPQLIRKGEGKRNDPFRYCLF